MSRSPAVSTLERWTYIVIGFENWSNPSEAPARASFEDLALANKFTRILSNYQDCQPDPSKL